MRYISFRHIIVSGLAIFSMFFGAGNLIYPLVVGMESGKFTIVGIAGFLITAVCLPLAGLIAMILFDGDYIAFFCRLGKVPGNLFIFVCMMVIGPLIGIPRIVTLSHTMIAPFLPFGFLKEIHVYSSLLFGLLFLGITFLMTYRENSIISILGYFISPVLITSLCIIILKGFLNSGSLIESDLSIYTIFKTNITRGYETLDLFAGIFFSAVILTILKQTFGDQEKADVHALAKIGLKAGLFGISLLAVIYCGMAFLGAYQGHNVLYANAGELFREIAIAVTGNYGAIVIAIAVVMACLSTAIALSAVTAEYIQHALSNNKLSFVQSLIIILCLSLPLSIFGLSSVLRITGGPITYIGYPLLITTTFCNIAYKLFGFSWIRLPVVVTGMLVICSYYF